MSVVSGGDWFSGWLGGSFSEVTNVPTPSPTPRPVPVPSPIAASSPDYVDHVKIGLSRLVQQFQFSGDE